MESLGRARVTQLTHVKGPHFERLQEAMEQAVDYGELFKKFKSRVAEPLGMQMKGLVVKSPDQEELQEFAWNPEAKVEALISEAGELLGAVRRAEEEFQERKSSLEAEMERRIEAERKALQEAKAELTKRLQELEGRRMALVAEKEELEKKTRVLRALVSDEYKGFELAGIVKEEYVDRINKYLSQLEGAQAKTVNLNGVALYMVYGGEEAKRWGEQLFMVYEAADLSQVLGNDTQVVGDEEKATSRLRELETRLQELEAMELGESEEEEKNIREKLASLEEELEEKAEAVKAEYEGRFKELEALKEEAAARAWKAVEEAKPRLAYFFYILRMYSRRNAPVLRGRVASFLQGYTPERLLPKLVGALEEIKGETGEPIHYEVEDLGEEDHNAPTPEAYFGSETLQPLWILTRLRGWPSAEEINPGYISVLVFAFQFGLMFGDIGQGLVFLALGLALRPRFNRGMMKYLTTLFIPMGLSAIIFGFLYDSIFLYEHQITHWLHGAHIELPFHYPIMPNPMHETGELMNLIFMVGALELAFGALLGAANAAKEGNWPGMLGEHGFGMGLYVMGLYLSVSTMFTEGLDIMQVIAAWPFKLMLLGMVLSFSEPIIHSLAHGHGIGGMESIGEGIGGLMMTFVEGLANMFSFLRIAAFAIAHVSLSGAGEALGHAIHNPIAGIVIMNVIALSFEFVSSSVQSLRLLYYEFMGKFFHGTGVPFKPFTTPPVTLVQE